MTDIAISSPSPRFELVGISKAFVGTQANDAIDLSVMPGEIHALLGENGAGKSTLVKIIYGILQADHGLLKWDGKPRRRLLRVGAMAKLHPFLLATRHPRLCHQRSAE